jgi:hypothetical protein
MEFHPGKQSNMWFVNKTNENVYVFISPSSDWTVIDVLTSFYVAWASAGTGAFAKVFSEVPKSIKSASDLFYTLKALYKVAKMMGIVGAAKVGMADEQHYALMQQMKKNIQSAAMCVKPGEAVVIPQKKLLAPLIKFTQLVVPSASILSKVNEIESERNSVKNKDITQEILNELKEIGSIPLELLDLLNPSFILSPFGINDVKVIVFNDSLSKLSIFSSNSDHSFIVKENEVIRSVYGHIHEEKQGNQRAAFITVKGEGLRAGDYLDPNEGFVVSYSKTVETRIKGGPGRGSTSKTYVKQKSFYVVVYQTDGNFVAYNAMSDSPTAIWASNTQHKPVGRVYLQGDGNLVVYGPNKEVHWALWKEMPTDKDYSKAFVTVKDGTLSYFLNESDEKPLRTISTQ